MALIITIIILLILAGVTIASLTGSGLFGKTEEAKIKQRQATAEEQLNLEIMRVQTVKNGNATLDDLFLDFSSNDNTQINVTGAEFASIATRESDVSEKIPDGKKVTEIKVTVEDYEEFEFTIGDEFEIDVSHNGESTSKVKVTFN